MTREELVQKAEETCRKLQSLAVDPRTLAPDGVGDVTSAYMALHDCITAIQADTQRIAGLEAVLRALNAAMDAYWNTESEDRDPEIHAVERVQQESLAVLEGRACLLCKGADEDPNFDYCRACGRKALVAIDIETFSSYPFSVMGIRTNLKPAAPKEGMPTVNLCLDCRFRNRETGLCEVFPVLRLRHARNACGGESWEPSR